jgi:hypothetical protein
MKNHKNTSDVPGGVHKVGSKITTIREDSTGVTPSHKQAAKAAVGKRKKPA